MSESIKMYSLLCEFVGIESTTTTFLVDAELFDVLLFLCGGGVCAENEWPCILSTPPSFLSMNDSLLQD